MWGYGLDRSGSVEGQVADTSECGKEPSGSMNCGEFIDWLKTVLRGTECLTVCTAIADMNFNY
jgi:hypothetical protein